MTPAEILLYIWIAGFAYDEFGEFNDAGQLSFYASDFWWTWDIVGRLHPGVSDKTDFEPEYCRGWNSLLCTPLVEPVYKSFHDAYC